MFTSKNLYMNCFVEMVNCSTGEIYYNKNLGYSFAIGMPNDVGMSKVRDIIESAIKGARIKREPLQVRLMFTEPMPVTLPLPFRDCNDFETPYEVKPF